MMDILIGDLARAIRGEIAPHQFAALLAAPVNGYDIESDEGVLAYEAMLEAAGRYVQEEIDADAFLRACVAAVAVWRDAA